MRVPQKGTDESSRGYCTSLWTTSVSDSRRGGSTRLAGICSRSRMCPSEGSKDIQAGCGSLKKTREAPATYKDEHPAIRDEVQEGVHVRGHHVRAREQRERVQLAVGRVELVGRLQTTKRR